MDAPAAPLGSVPSNPICARFPAAGGPNAPPRRRPNPSSGDANVAAVALDQVHTRREKLALRQTIDPRFETTHHLRQTATRAEKRWRFARTFGRTSTEICVRRPRCSRAETPSPRVLRSSLSRQATPSARRSWSWLVTRESEVMPRARHAVVVA